MYAGDIGDLRQLGLPSYQRDEAPARLLGRASGGDGNSARRAQGSDHRHVPQSRRLLSPLQQPGRYSAGLGYQDLFAVGRHLFKCLSRPSARPDESESAVAMRLVGRQFLRERGLVEWCLVRLESQVADARRDDERPPEGDNRR